METNTITEGSAKPLLVIDQECLYDTLARIVESAIEKHFEKPKMEKMLTIRQVGEILGVDPSTLWKWDREGYLCKTYIGGKPRYKESEVMAIREGRSVKPEYKRRRNKTK